MPRKPSPEFPRPVLVTDTAELAALCARVRTEPYVTIDTEFMRERTYYPELCVVQLAGTGDVAVIDALAPGIDLAPLGELLMRITGPEEESFSILRDHPLTPERARMLEQAGTAATGPVLVDAAAGRALRTVCK